MMDNLSLVQRVVIWILPIVFALTVHEFAHGWMARRYGDNTAYMLGRLTLNPIKHIDWLGTVLLPGILMLSGTHFIFGWAKPVPVNSRNFKNPRQDMAIVALAGPVSNLLMALAWALLARIGVVVGIESISLPFIYSGMAGISINLGLMVLNMLPIPPLDGSRVVSGLLSPKLAWRYNQLEQYGFIILIEIGRASCRERVSSPV